MDLRRQIGSLFIIGFTGTTFSREDLICRNIVEHGLGGVILFSRCLHNPALAGNITSADQLTSLTESLQKLTGSTLLIGVDQEGGKVQRLSADNGFYSTKSAAEMGIDENRELTRQAARRTAALLDQCGINLNFAPVVDLNINPENPVIGKIGRSFSADQHLVMKHAAVWIQEHRKQNVLSCVKHFPGHGSSAGDSHKGFVDISASWLEKELTPYRGLIADDLVDLVMTGHLFNSNLDPDFPATLSKNTITNLLRGELGYNGVVVSDDMQMRAITDHYPFSEAICRSLAAGVDILVFGNNLDYNPDICGNAIDAVMAGLKQGVVSEERLFSAITKVANLKKNLDKA